ncbi:hypothetical protein BCR39DRAFT_513755 [Naematelia encephala]|uniref:NADPH:adrenodoxin oxidoreductase, mitochondrial n=1 Tax=Naematelia encephala TaxID=71784 RepID=A0A1Y2BIN5_9TREE|nr:hypothetical protein BCR39DRAFT_513755 [Naematelia encephala]
MSVALAGPSRLRSNPSISRVLKQSCSCQRYRPFSTTSNLSARPRPLKLAIIGAGPSGFYAASRILSLLPPDSERGKDVQVHMYERLPTPYGLVRYGVAPDHPEVKNCQHKFDELSDDHRFTYLGNTAIGSQASSDPLQESPATTLSRYTYPHALHLPLSDILPHYTSVLFTYGASLSQPLSDVPGSSSSSSTTGHLEGVYPALAFVSWYNGHPAFSHLSPDLSKVQDVTVIGHGNVALDVARILLKPVQSLDKTDMPQSVLDVLEKSKVRTVTVVGRRGPAQVSFTTKEFREMLHLPRVEYKGIDGVLAQQATKMVKGDRMRTRLLGLMSGSSNGQGDEGQGQGGKKEFKLEFLQSPKAFLSESGNGRVETIEWTKNQLLVPSPQDEQGSPPQSQAESVPRPQVIARSTGQTSKTKTDLVIESVGYRSEPLGIGEEWNLPFDGIRGRISNVSGRVVGEDGNAIPGMYAAGWAARGPVGVIASTMNDAYSLSALILQDHFDSPSTISNPSAPLGNEPRLDLPEAVQIGLKQGKVVDLAGWKRIDEAEQKRATGGKQREKFTNVQDMLSVLS